MKFINHSELEGLHAFLGASNYHWLNYDEEKLISVYENLKQKEKGTELHDFAKSCINLRQRLPKTRHTLNMYINDAIGYRMSPEVILYFSCNCFGTADSICFDGKMLRIHDLKTGTTTASFKQLIIYSAIFCLEYEVDPRTINIELRIYQNDSVNNYIPQAEEIIDVQEKIKKFDKLLERVNAETYG